MHRGSETSVVAVEPVAGDVAAAVRAAMTAAGYAEHVPRGSRVAVKPNLGWDLLIPGSVTSPLVLAAVLDVLKEHGCDLRVVEAGQVLEDVERVFRRHFAPLCRERGVPFANMSRGPRHTVKVEGARVFPEVAVSEALSDALLVTVPVMKTHDKTGLSGAIKNQWGCLPESRHNWHMVLDDALVDILRATRPAFAVMDATVALEGDGPKTGRPRVMDLVLASADPVALDAVQGYLMGLRPEEARHVQLCGEAGLGEHRLDHIVVKGPRLEGLRQDFRRAGHNLVSRVELACRLSRWRRLVFHTPLFSAMVLGAKLWYLLWSALGPRRRIWREARAHPVYGKQWR